LQQYFLPHELEPFLNMQEACDVVISGSTVLQFFTGLRWDSDLDLYVVVSECRSAGLLLLSCNYEFVPSRHQDPEFLRVVSSISDAVPPTEVGPNYNDSGIASVFNFSKGTKSIQLIACRTNVMQVILGFHSTCVMNFATRHYAVSLFPVCSLVSHSSLINVTDADIRVPTNALSKYAERGWELLTLPSYNEYLSGNSELGQNIRYPGD
ncbi:hypothetical protein K435DRAFT_622665, partial [Dendrothele bispora CBS 962.96]